MCYEFLIINNILEMKNTKEVNKFKLVTLKELGDIVSKMPKPVPIWRGINEGNFGYFYGPSKAGKSTCAENLAMSIACGRSEFWGYKLYKGKPEKVLFINFEENCLPRMRRSQNQMKALSNEEVLLVNKNFIVPDCNFLNSLSSKQDWIKLQEVIKKSGAKIVFIDSITRLYSGSIEDSKESQKLTLNLRKMQKELDLTLTCIHHSTKSLGILAQDSLAGSRVIGQEADFAIGINKTKYGKLYLKEIFYRYAEIRNVGQVELFKIDENQWLRKLEKTSEHELINSVDFRQDPTNFKALKDFIEKEYPGGKFKTSNLMKEFVKTGVISKPTLHEYLKILNENKVISRVKRGEYSVESNLKKRVSR